MIAALAISIVGALAPGRLRIGELDVVGPVSGLVLDAGSAGETRFAREFRSGERLRVAAPIAVADASAPVAPEIRWTRDEAEETARGSVRFAGWREDRAALELGELPPGLLARPRPPVSPPEIRASRATLALLLASFVVGLAVRRRRAVAIAVGALGAALVLAAGRPRSRGLPEVASVVESETGSEGSLYVWASFGRVASKIPDLEGASLETAEDRARLVWSEGEDGETWTVTSPGTPIYLLRKLVIGEEGFTRERNKNRALAETWVREDGAWSARGPWPAGAPLPEPRDAPPAPGWLQAGLPQGVPILLGRVADDGIRRVDDGGASLFVRLSGF